jgi:hypothetical protein
MAGYSGTPLPKKLGIKENHRVAIINSPAEFGLAAGELPAGVKIATRRTTGPLDVVLYFTKSRTELRKQFGKLASALSPAGGLWIAWPKKASGIPTDLSEDSIREIGLSAGLVDNKVCAIDEVWSGLRFVLRLKDRRTETETA